LALGRGVEMLKVAVRVERIWIGGRWIRGKGYGIEVGMDCS